MRHGIFAAVAVLMSFLSLTGRAEDSYLYWMYDNTSSYSFNSVNLKAMPSGGDSFVIGTYAASSGVDLGTGVSFYNMRTTVSPASSGYSFMLELLNDGGVVTHASDWIEWAVSTDALRESAILAFGVAPVPVPEPTSGLLLLFGVAALALRRKSVGGEV